MFDEKQSLTRLQLVLGERELLCTFTLDLDWGDAEGRLLVQSSATVRAETSLILVRMPTSSAVQGRSLPCPVLAMKVEVEARA
jgi:hypothetical protein